MICYESRRHYTEWVFYRVVLVSVKWGFSDLSIPFCGVPGFSPEKESSGNDFSVGLGLSFVLFWWLRLACEHKVILKAFWRSTTVLCAATAWALESTEQTNALLWIPLPIFTLAHTSWTQPKAWVLLRTSTLLEEERSSVLCRCKVWSAARRGRRLLNHLAL